MFTYILIIALFLILVHILFNYNERARMFRKIPGPKTAFIFGNGLDIIVSQVDVMRLVHGYTSKFKSLYRHWSFPVGIINIYNPEDIEIILPNVNYMDKSILYNILQPWLRDGLLLSKGEKWHQRRKLLTPAFHFNILRRYYTVLQENNQRLVEKLEKISGESVDVVPVISEYTLHSICETAMGTQLNESSGAGRRYKQAVYDLGKAMLHRLLRFYLMPDLFFNLSTTGRHAKKLLQTIHKFTENVIIDRKKYINKNGVQLAEENEEVDNVYKGKNKKTPMLDLLLLAEKDGLIDTLGIQEEVDTFMFEGHDTTAAGLIFNLMLLAKAKDVQKKIYSELTEIFGDSNRLATMEDLSKMKYLECCIKESLRLYPPVPIISRKIYESVQLSGYTVPANSVCNIHIMALHRNPDVYQDPMVFDPDRFLPENSVGRHPYAYVPFSAGPRNCIGMNDTNSGEGQKFAMMEMKSAVAEILRKFELEPVTLHEEIEFTADVVLRHVGPIYVKFVRRPPTS